MNQPPDTETLALVMCAALIPAKPVVLCYDILEREDFQPTCSAPGEMH